MLGVRFKANSIRAKLAAILGFTIFALAATRAIGPSQLGTFLDRFRGYMDRLEAMHLAASAAHLAEQGLYTELLAARAVPPATGVSGAADDLRRATEPCAGPSDPAT